MAPIYRAVASALLLLAGGASASQLSVSSRTLPNADLVKRAPMLFPRTPQSSIMCSDGGTTCAACFGPTYASCPQGSTYTCYDTSDTQDTESAQCNGSGGSSGGSSGSSGSSTSVPGTTHCSNGGTTCAECFGTGYTSCPTDGVYTCWNPSNTTAGPESLQCYGVFPSSTLTQSAAKPTATGGTTQYCSDGGTTCAQCFGSTFTECPAGSTYGCWDTSDTQDSETVQCGISGSGSGGGGGGGFTSSSQVVRTTASVRTTPGASSSSHAVIIPNTSQTTASRSTSAASSSSSAAAQGGAPRAASDALSWSGVAAGIFGVALVGMI